MTRAMHRCVMHPIPGLSPPPGAANLGSPWGKGSFRTHLRGFTNSGRVQKKETDLPTPPSPMWLDRAKFS